MSKCLLLTVDMLQPRYRTVSFEMADPLPESVELSSGLPPPHRAVHPDQVAQLSPSYGSYCTRDREGTLQPEDAGSAELRPDGHAQGRSEHFE